MDDQPILNYAGLSGLCRRDRGGKHSARRCGARGRRAFHCDPVHKPGLRVTNAGAAFVAYGARFCWSSRLVGVRLDPEGSDPLASPANQWGNRGHRRTTGGSAVRVRRRQGHRSGRRIRRARPARLSSPPRPTSTSRRIASRRSSTLVARPPPGSSRPRTSRTGSPGTGAARAPKRDSPRPGVTGPRTNGT
jgi:hypothetical protein